jgi:thiol-disulfide isomerase/thioredoxin
MKKLLFTILLGLSVILYSQESGIKFSNDSLLSDALLQSKKEGKLLFIDCYTVWCGPCKQLASQVFPQKEVGDFFNSHFINLSFDMEKSEGSKIMKQYNIKAFPTLLFLDSNGEIAHISIGAGGADALIELGKAALDSTNNFKALNTKIKNGDRSAQTLSLYLRANRYATNKDSLLTDYFNSVSTEDKLSKDSWDLFNNLIDDIDDSQFQFFLKHRDSYELKFGKVNIDNKIMQGFDYYAYKYRETPDKLESLKSIDSVLYLKYLERNEFQMAFGMTQSKKDDKGNWDNFLLKAKSYLSQDSIHPMELNNVSWYIYENYKTFNDTVALRLAKDWSFRSYQAMPGSHLINDTYGHILFDLGYINEALIFEEIAVKQAFEEKSDDAAKFYTDEVERFKKELK